MNIRIGPAGLGSVKTALNTLGEYHKLGFRACEIAFTYGVYIKDKKDAEVIGKKAKELGISLSIHAPYFINLNSVEKIKRENSKKRILECCKVGEWLEAERVVFHPGYYSKNREESYSNIKNSISDMMKYIRKNNWKIKICPEIMGRVNVFGSIDEIAGLIEDTKCDFCIDFAHILAREKKIDYEKVKKLFKQREWHTHFSGIIYGEKGEKQHRKTEKKEWEDLLRNLPKEKKIVIINESPSMVEDCIEGIEISKTLH